MEKVTNKSSNHAEFPSCETNVDNVDNVDYFFCLEKRKPDCKGFHSQTFPLKHSLKLEIKKWKCG